MPLAGLSARQPQRIASENILLHSATTRFARIGGRCACRCDLAVQPVDIGERHIRHLPAPQPRQDVILDEGLVILGCERVRFFGKVVLDVALAQVGHGRRFPLGLFLGQRVAPAVDLAPQPLGLVTRGLELQAGCWPMVIRRSRPPAR
jgi:hypothetical protein